MTALTARRASRAEAPPFEQRKTKAVKWWAALGAACLATWAYLWIRWVASGNATPTPTGLIPVPGWMRAAAHLHEVVAWSLLGSMVFFWIVRPWLRERRLTSDGMLLIGGLSCIWQDMLPSYHTPFFTYNTAFIQFGSWNNFIPGFQTPNSHLIAEPLVFALGIYPVSLLLASVLGLRLISTARARWPQMGNTGLFALVFVPLAVVDAVVELAFLRLGLYAYPAAWGPTAFKGHYYQYPLIIAFLWGGCFWTAMTAIRYFKDDRGRTVAERGAEELRATRRQKTGLRLLAVVGLVNAMFMVFNFALMNVAARSGRWSDDVVKRSYLTNQLCGPGTDYACPGPAIPMARPHSAHVGPDGTLVVPEGTKLR